MRPDPQKCLRPSTGIKSMCNNRNPISVEAVMLGQAQAARVPLQCRRVTGFTLVELLVSVGVLAVLVFLATQLINSMAAITTLGHKQMDADSQARQVLDRMAVDFAQMIKRSDVTFYFKGGTGVSQTGNDQIAFYTATPGYYSTATST